MTRKKQRAILIVSGLGLLSIATAFVLIALRSNVTFFKSPTDVVQDAPRPGVPFRLGGLVEQGSYHKLPDATVTFTVTDGKASIPVTFKGILPDLFREGQGIVAEGQIDPAGGFIAKNVLAKHDEKYMPPEVAAALKKSGRWQEKGNTALATPGS